MEVSTSTIILSKRAIIQDTTSLYHQSEWERCLALPGITLKKFLQVFVSLNPTHKQVRKWSWQQQQQNLLATTNNETK